MPNIMYTKNGQGPFPVPSTGMFRNIKTSSANSLQEALSKTEQQLPIMAPGFKVKNGLMDVKMKGNVYIVETQNGGRKSRRHKRKTARKTKSRRRKTHRH